MAANGPASRPVLVLDFGAQYVQLIARRVRERHAFARIVRHDITAERVRELNPLALDPLGRARRAFTNPERPTAIRQIFELGIADPGNLLRNATGLPRPWAPRCRRSAAREFGRARVPGARPRRAALSRCAARDDRLDEPRRPDPGRRRRFLAAGRRLRPARSRRSRIVELPFYGLQFHPEVSHTPYGSLILGNFLDRICQNPRTGRWGRSSSGRSSEILRRVGPTDRVVCGLSGGVDSAVCAALLAKALGPRVVCVFVDTGLLRPGERAAVAEAFGSRTNAELRVIDASRSVPGAP